MNFYFGRKTNKFHEKLGTVWKPANNRCTNGLKDETGENPYGKLHLLKKIRKKKKDFEKEWRIMILVDIESTHFKIL